jgi:hypothetical protein
LISSARLSGSSDVFSHLVRIGATGTIDGHWEYTNTGSSPVLWNFQIMPSGHFYFGGHDNNNLGSWQTATHTEEPPVGEVRDEPFTLANASLLIEDKLITASDISGTLDSGGGGYDLLAIKLDPASLPAP